MILTVKNMICQRCKIVVDNILTSLGFKAENISIGEILLKESLSDTELEKLNAALKETGLELVFNQKLMLVQKIINIIFETVLYSREPLLVKFSCYLSKRLNYNYTYLANIFKEINGISIERYVILQRIEMVKEMLVKEDAHLTEIAYKLNYCSVSHLSAQFKRVTGISFSDYKLKNRNGCISMLNLIAV